jgi:hypothetical protein
MRFPERSGRPIGTLYDDLAEVAIVVVRLCAHTPMTAWVDHCDIIHVDSPSRVSAAPPDWIVGTYDPEAAVADVEDDLQRMFDEHCIAGTLTYGPSSLLSGAKDALRLTTEVSRMADVSERPPGGRN